jgi:pimeloyl-ACP methyl ester carboxylesterase
MKALPHRLIGNKESKVLLVFLHGYPDTLDLWNDIISKFQNDYLTLNISYPNFSEEEISPLGSDHYEIVKRIHITITQYNTKSNRPIIFITHDWGAFYGFMFDAHYPKFISDMVVMDIGPKHKITSEIHSYQQSLILGYMIGGSLGQEITKDILWDEFKYAPKQLNKINGSWNYPYYFFCKNSFDIGKIYAKYKPSCTVSFLYGKKKPAMFHSADWIKYLQNTPDCEAHAMNTGHWIMTEEPEYVARVINNRIEMVKERNVRKPKF